MLYRLSADKTGRYFMKLVKRIFIVLIILLTLNLYLPNITFAQQTHFYAKAQITQHPPQILASPEEKIPVKKVTKKKSKWLWKMIGLIVTGGAAYYLLQEREEPVEEDTGSIVISGPAP